MIAIQPPQGYWTFHGARSPVECPIAVFRRGLGTLVAYDCNRTNVQQWVEAANASGVMDNCIVPNYLPFSEGFLRQPNYSFTKPSALASEVLEWSIFTSTPASLT